MGQNLIVGYLNKGNCVTLQNIYIRGRPKSFELALTELQLNLNVNQILNF